jgi:hypothetical protein
MKNVRIAIAVFLFVLMLSTASEPQALHDPLLEHFAGNWLLQGTIAGRETTHDIESEWVLNHQYIRLHELSRDKTSAGQPAYEAIVFIGMDPASSGYSCLWLDSTAGTGLSAQGIAHAKPSGNEIPFLFQGKDGSTFHTTFVYAPATDTWQWIMDGEEGGKLVPFARVKLTRK